MNNKVKSLQVGMFLILACCGMFIGLNDIILLRKSGNEVLIAMILGTIIGLIPVLMVLKIGSYYPDLNLYEKNKKLFGDKLGAVINVILLLFCMFVLTIVTRIIGLFVTGKYLQSTPYYIVGLLAIITNLIICLKGIEVIVRTSQITFFASLFFMIIIEVLLSKYVEIDNIMPIIINRKHIMGIIDGAIFHAFTCAFISTLFLCINKDKIVDKEKYNKTFIICYLVASLVLTLVMFFILSCFGYNISTLFRFPEYILLKKIEISNTGLHLENLLAFRWLFYMIALGNIVTYNIICIIKSFSNKEKLSNYIVIFICLLCLFISKMIFYNVPSSIRNIKLYYVPYVTLPIFILLTITYILCLFKKRESH